MESQSAVSHVKQDTNTAGGHDDLGKSPMLSDLQGANSVTDVAETAVIDHGSHNVDIPIKGHFLRSGSAEGGELKNEERSCDRAEDQGAK